MATESVSKTCVKCGEDVSERKRHKDAKGRYWCEACYGQALARARAKKERARGDTGAAGGAARAGGSPGSGDRYGVAPSEDEVMSSLLAGSKAVEGEPCPACHTPMPPDAVVCTSCGFSREASRQVRTVVKVQKEPGKSPKIGAPDVSGLAGNPGVVLALAAGAGLLPLLAIASEQLLLPLLIVTMVAGLGLTIWVLVEGFRVSLLSGILLIVTYFIPLVNLIYWLYFIFLRNENQALKLIYAGFLGGAVVTSIAISTGAVPGVEELVSAPTP